MPVVTVDDIFSKETTQFTVNIVALSLAVQYHTVLRDSTVTRQYMFMNM